MDTIAIHQLEVETHIGMTEKERSTSQRLWVSLTMKTDTKAAAKHDEPIIDYAVIAGSVRKLIESVTRNTIERLAEDIATHVIDTYGTPSVEVTIYKYILPDAQSVSVSITRP